VAGRGGIAGRVDRGLSSAAGGNDARRAPVRLRIVGCEVLVRPLYLAAARSPHVVDLTLLRKGLHDRPGGLREELQAEIDRTGPEYDAVGLAYGLCGGATNGVIARTMPVVMPRAHDCITLFLGSRERYAEEFMGHPGTFWYAQDYMERADDGTPVGMGAESDEARQRTYAEYVEKYGLDNADYLMEALGEWRSHYDRAAFVDLGVSDGSAVEADAIAQAASRGWGYARLAGDMILVRRLVDGEWDADFLVIEPGQRAVQAWDEGVVRAEPVDEAAGNAT
jgi:hypothetical protein